MKIIKNKKILEDSWIYCDTLPIPKSDNIIVPLTLWKKEKKSIATRQNQLGLRLFASDRIEENEVTLKTFDLIEFYFDVFTDGRSFSQIKLIHDKFNYQGEVRASGHFLRDQLFYLSEVGVNSFNCATDLNLDGMLSSLNDFSVSYQRTKDDLLS